MKTHHLTYDELKQFHTPKKLDLSRFEDLHYGDKIKMQDGQLLGTFTEILSDFDINDGLYTKENCKDLIKYDPRLFYYQSGGPNGIESKTGVYGTRKIVSSSGDMIEQGLIKQFNEPAWINFPEKAKILHADSESSLSL